MTRAPAKALAFGKSFEREYIGLRDPRTGGFTVYVRENPARVAYLMPISGGDAFGWGEASTHAQRASLAHAIAYREDLYQEFTKDEHFAEEVADLLRENFEGDFFLIHGSTFRHMVKNGLGGYGAD